MQTQEVHGVTEHHFFRPGQAKTVCTSAVLAYFGVHPSTYHYSGQIGQRAAVLRRNGYAVRSRASRVGLTNGVVTVGMVKEFLRKARGLHGARFNKWGDPLAHNGQTSVAYMLRVQSGSVTHAMLLDSRGGVLVDTDPRNRDRRVVLAIHAIYPVS